MGPRSFALVGSRDQWFRSSHDGTHLDADGVVGLAWTTPPASADGGGAGAEPAGGLAFDAECRLYRSLPREGRVVRHLWHEPDAPGRSAGPAARAVPLFDEPVAPAGPADAGGGDFRPATADRTALDEPRGLAVDAGDRLFIAETGARRVVVYDLWSRALVRRITLPDGDAPVDLAAAPGGGSVLVLGRAGGVTEVTARDLVRPVPVAVEDEVPPAAAPARIETAPDGHVLVLDRAGTAQARIVFLAREASGGGGAGIRLRPVRELAVPGAGDMAFDGGGRLVVARAPGDDFRRFELADGPVEALPLRARGYDGRGIVRTPDGRIGFWTDAGFGAAVRASVDYRARGRVTTFRLDGGEWGTRWGRIFLDACVPDGCRVRIHTAVADEPPAGPRLPRVPPAGVADPPPDDGLSPPMPPVSLVPAEDAVVQPLHRRETGRELPWSDPPADDPFRTYEAPGPDATGRYLWITLELVGTTKRTPWVRSLRIERPAHDLMRRLPKVFSRDDAAAGFLQRYLGMVDGFLTELDGRGAARHALLLPRGAPAEFLPWLAAFLGLMLDERWPERTRRRIIAEAHRLFRFRGTVPGLRRFLELYVEDSVVLVEHFRLRGLGGSVLGDTGAAVSSSVLGGGFRVGGRVGEDSPAPLEGTVEDAFQSHAHRFTVLVGRSLDEEELDVVERILELHRPAHTTFDVCMVDAGMRVGRGLHLGLSSLIGRTGGFETARLGSSVLGRRAVLGRPGPGTRIGAARLGRDTEAG